MDVLKIVDKLFHEPTDEQLKPIRDLLIAKIAERGIRIFPGSNFEKLVLQHDARILYIIDKLLSVFTLSNVYDEMEYSEELLQIIVELLNISGIEENRSTGKIGCIITKGFENTIVIPDGTIFYANTVHGNVAIQATEHFTAEKIVAPLGTDYLFAELNAQAFYPGYHGNVPKWTVFTSQLRQNGLVLTYASTDFVGGTTEIPATKVVRTAIALKNVFNLNQAIDKYAPFTVLSVNELPTREKVLHVAPADRVLSPLPERVTAVVKERTKDTLTLEIPETVLYTITKVLYGEHEFDDIEFYREQEPGLNGFSSKAKNYIKVHKEDAFTSDLYPIIFAYGASGIHHAIKMFGNEYHVVAAFPINLRIKIYVYEEDPMNKLAALMRKLIWKNVSKALTLDELKNECRRTATQEPHEVVFSGTLLTHKPIGDGLYANEIIALERKNEIRVEDFGVVNERTAFWTLNPLDIEVIHDGNDGKPLENTE